MPVKMSDWKSGGAKMLEERMPSTGEDRYRTCCNCWHIKIGTLFLGILELVAVSVLLSGLVRQIRWKNHELSICAHRNLPDCLLFNFSHLNLTFVSYIGDYVIASLLVAIIFCILLLFYGILTIAPKFLWPHLVIQAIGLLTSFGYFFLYAWHYFYGDLYTQRRSFQIQYFVERMWLSTILLIFSLFQCYLFLTVIKCSLYLNKLKQEQARKKMQFEDVSNRVRIAKENGLWRNTSWGGGFQQYRGQYEKKPTKTEEKKPKASSNRVQWNLSRNEEKSIHSTPDRTEKSLELSAPTEEPAATPLQHKDKPKSTRKKENSDSPPAGQKHHKSSSGGKTPLALTHSLDTSKTGRPVLHHNSYSVEGPRPPNSPKARKGPLTTAIIIPTVLKGASRSASVKLPIRQPYEFNSKEGNESPINFCLVKSGSQRRGSTRHNKEGAEGGSPPLKSLMVQSYTNQGNSVVVKKVSIASKYPTTSFQFKTISTDN